jgi:hypothetical protein
MVSSESNARIYLSYIIPIIVAGVLLGVWNSTNPATVGPLGILVVFILLYIFWVSVFFVLVHFVLTAFHHSLLLQRIFKRTGTHKSYKKREYLAYYTASVLAFAPVLLLAMQSVNQLSFRDIALVFIFVGLAIFYLLRRL